MSPLDRYVEAGARRPGIWRVLAGLVLIGAFWIGGTFLVLLGWSALKGGPGDALSRLAGQPADTLSAASRWSGPEVVIVAMTTFAGIWLGVLLAVRLLHGQRFSTLFSPEGRLRRGDLLCGLLVATAFAAASLPLALAVAQPAWAGLPVTVWLAALLPVAVLVFVQATAEELIFRGYLLQQLALRSRNPLVWAVVPSALFGALHYANEPGGATGLLYVGTTFLMGLALAALVWRTGSLWAAVGVHVGFNIVGLTLVGTEGVMSGTQLLLFPAVDMPAVMAVDMTMTALLLAFVLSPWAPFGPRATRTIH